MNPQSFFKSLIWDNLVTAALDALFRAVPLLGWGPFGTVISYMATKYADVLFDGVTLYVDVGQIVIRNENLRTAYDKASLALMIATQTMSTDSPKFEELHEENKKALADLIRFDL